MVAYNRQQESHPERRWRPADTRRSDVKAFIYELIDEEDVPEREHDEENDETERTDKDDELTAAGPATEEPTTAPEAPTPEPPKVVFKARQRRRSIIYRDEGDPTFLYVKSGPARREDMTKFHEGDSIVVTPGKAIYKCMRGKERVSWRRAAEIIDPLTGYAEQW